MKWPIVYEEWIPALPVDSFGNVDLKSLFLAFQDAATEHTVQMGIDKDFYRPLHLLYVLCRIKVEFLAPFPKEGKIRLVTYGLFPGRISFLRDCYLEDEKGRMLLKLRTLWVLIDEVRRRIVPTDLLAERMEPMREELDVFPAVFDEDLSSLEEEEGAERVFDYVVSEKDIDVNRHMNNTVYFSLVEQAGIEGRMAELEINFEKECLLGDLLTVYRKEGYYCGYRRGELSFKCRVVLL